VTRLVLVRHAEPSEEVRGRCYGSLDVGLSAAGRAQADQLVARLADIDCDAVVTSPRLRARETARPYAAARGIECSTDERLREIEFGMFEGRTYEEIEVSEPTLFRQWMESPATVRFPGGESYVDLRHRALAALDELRGRHAMAVVVTHGGVIRAGLAAWLELPDHAIFRLDQSYCGITIVEWLGSEPIVRTLNG
jgi:alpha-ribazole phosphatase/probable phosphoglycerate mutase